MSDPITNRVAQILSESEQIMVPCEQLYDQLASEGLMVWMTQELLEELILSDERFQIYDGFGDSGLLDSFIQAELSSRGLLGGPLVVLSNRSASDEDLMVGMLLHLQEMNRALETAWSLRPSDNPAVEAELLSLLMMGDILEREIKRALETGSTLDEFNVSENVKDVANK